MTALFKSLRFKAYILILAFTMIPLFVTSFFYSFYIERRQVSSLSASMTSQAQMISSRLMMGGILRTSERDDSVRDYIYPVRDMVVARIMVTDPGLSVLLDTYDDYEGKILLWENAARSASGESVSEYDATGNTLVVTVPVGSSEDIVDGNIQGVVILIRNTDFIRSDIVFFRLISVIIILSGLFLAVAGGIIMSRFMVNPLRELATDTNDVLTAAKEEIPMKGIKETDAIAKAINDVSWKLGDLDKSMKDFASNVSHELKTPLTSMKIMADTLLAAEDTPLEFYKEFMGDISAEIDRETGIINDLLDMTKNGAENASLNLESVNINDFLEQILKTLSPIAEKARVELLIETFKPVMAEIDRIKFSQAMINLVENAIKYNVEEGYVHVTVNSDANNCFIRIEDGGVGIPEEDLDQIFERFYRVDKSHSKEIEGTGLGLSIVKNIISLHHGEIKADSIEGKGTTFSVKIPLIYDENL